MPDAALRTVVIGAGGRIARDYLDVLETRAEFDVCGLVEPIPSARAALRGAPTFANVGALLAAVRPDAALIVAPPSEHEALAIAQRL